MPSLYHKARSPIAVADDGDGGVSYRSNALLWTATALSVVGVVTFHPTTDGTIGGDALFSEIHTVQLTARNYSQSAVDVPLVAVQYVNPNLRTILGNVVVGRTLAALGDTLEWAPDDTLVYALVVGVAA